MNDTLITIYSAVNNIFTVDPMFLKLIRKDICRWVYSVYNIDLSEARTTSIINYSFLHVHFITGGETFIDTISVDNEPTIIVVVPSEMYNDDFDKLERIKIIYNIYKYILDYLAIPLLRVSSLYKLYKISPSFLTALTLDQFQTTDIENYIMRKNIINVNDVKYVLDHRDDVDQFFGDALLLDMIKK